MGSYNSKKLEEEKRRRELEEERKRIYKMKILEEERRQELENERRRREELERQSQVRLAREKQEEADRKKQEAIWRIDNLGSWCEEDKLKLLTKISEAASVKDSFGNDPAYFRIIFVGHMGAGKSSVINAFNSALKGSVDNRAVESGTDHTTKHFIEYPAFDHEGNVMKFTFCDVRGTGTAAAGSTNVDLLSAILGQKKVGEEFQPGHNYERSLTVTNMDLKSAFMIVYVMDAHAHFNRKNEDGGDPFLPQVLSLKDQTDSWPVSRALILTHMDELVPELLEDISKIHKNANVKQIVEEIIETTKFPYRCVFPVVNPVKFVHEIPDKFSVHLFYTLLSLVRDASDTYKQRIFHNNRVSE